ncbi:MAG: hypothetical protein L0K07_05465 [Yaniella sp.]|uniref:hypothetical protein n=1 Tax=Yaniella sp. TaxID=2773929 RepID=UPI00264800CD|nr:hypothetical protein [Yaniella sp.]MDN5731922.1 hypothetical protein [Yaniella sp.]MDN5742039.1 hypothetical protein [Yaniella sp.]MDN5816103.1 hypothetical protein [Yaniella sp.]MDN5819068.1 hypothetical protein [Yaniella sp.]MDN5839367.1 hypothetical protein [Yaniella sp.]
MTQDDLDPEFLGDFDEPDLEMPEDGRDSQPPTEGSSDDPESLEAEDPLHDDETVLSASTGRNTIVDHDPEPLEDDDWALEEEQIVDEDELEDRETGDEFPQ